MELDPVETHKLYASVDFASAWENMDGKSW